MNTIRLILAWLLMSGFFNLFSQQTYLGLSGGGHVNGAWIEHSLRGQSYNTQLIQGLIPGMHAGVQLKHYNEIKSFRKLHSGIQISAYYFQRGWQQQYLLTEGPITRMNYLHIPIDALIFLGSETSRVFFLLGIYYEQLIDFSVPQEPASSLTLNETFYTYDPSRGDRDWGYGFNGGAGWHGNVLGQSVEVSAFFSYTLSNFIEINRVAEPIPDVSNLWSAGLRVGYFIPLGKN